MLYRLWRIPILVFLMYFGMRLLSAEQTGEFSFTLRPDGTPEFTQVLRWNGDTNALYYEVTLQTADGRPLSEIRLEEPVLRLNLSPGEYRYRIAAYNLLRKPEVTLPWCDITVLQAEFPQITDTLPKMWFLDDLMPELTLRGEQLIQGATAVLRREGAAPGNPVTGSEIGREGTSAVIISFPAASVTTGIYTVEITNPGGLSFTYPHALLVRRMLPSPEGLSPASGTIYGPDELRGMTSIHFSWNPVKEAAHYRFCIYSGNDGSPLLSVNSVEETGYLLDKLTILDRGVFRWTVEPQGSDPLRGIIPAAAPAEAEFTIDLPQLNAPDIRPGDTFYGR